MSSSNRDENANKLVRVVKGGRQHEIKSFQRTLESRKSARDTRSRLLSDSSDEVPKSILKNRPRFPTKRSVSECVDDLSQIMADLDITIDDLSKATGKFCPHKHFFDEGEEEHDGTDEYDADDQDDDDCDADADEHDDYDDEEEDDEVETAAANEASCFGNNGDQLQHYGKQRKCDCNFKVGDTGDSTQIIGNNNNNNDKPKKSVRFDEKVYETYFIASRLYDRRCFAKYHSSTRHHPPTKQSKKQQQNKTKRSKRNTSKNSEDESNSKNMGNSDESTTTSSKGSSACKLSKSQRAKQSKKDKKRRLEKRTDDGHDSISSDDQGYCSSSLHSSSD